jgi:hypothetical protein
VGKHGKSLKLLLHFAGWRKFHHCRHASPQRVWMEPAERCG